MHAEIGEAVDARVAQALARALRVRMAELLPGSHWLL
jgi:hypothetical protein